MTLEQRLSDALHQVDRVEPSPDLFSRVQRSVAEDIAHRRRARIAWLATAGGVATTVLFLGGSISRDGSGYLTIPIWVVELWETAVLIALVLLLAPLIRRFGGPFIHDVFRLDPAAGERFLPLLDIAYYLVFLGRLFMTTDVTGLGRDALLGVAFQPSAERIGVTLALMGALHALTLATLPVVGLVFSSSRRRVARREAGPLAPPVSSRALQADRLASWIVWVSAGLVLGLGLLGVGMAFGLGLDP